MSLWSQRDPNSTLRESVGGKFDQMSIERAASLLREASDYDAKAVPLCVKSWHVHKAAFKVVYIQDSSRT